MGNFLYAHAVLGRNAQIVRIPNGAAQLSSGR